VLTISACARSAKPAKVALLATMSKLLTAVDSVARHRQPFTLARIFPPVVGGAVTLALASRKLYASISETFLAGAHGI
jgi:hypothetical protein